MDAHLMDLQSELRRAGLVIRLDGDDLLVQDSGVDLRGWRAFLTARKAEIVRLLRAEPNALAPAGIRSLDTATAPRTYVSYEREATWRFLAGG